MKKFGIFLLTTAIVAMSLNSCDKDSFSEEDAMNLQAQLDKQKQAEQDSINVRNQRVSYTVTLVDASTSTLKSGSAVSAISGAKVKFVQDTTIIIEPADASGVVTFTNLKPGNANINISLEGYSEVNYTVNLSASVAGGGQVSNIIPMIPTSGTGTGTIKGKVIYEGDLTNKTPEVAPVGTKVLAMVSSSSAALPSNNNIVKISYDNLSLTATTDVNGEFTMTVPATILGLDYSIIVSDFTVNQKILQKTYLTRDTFGVLSIPTSFGTTFKSNNSFINSSTVEPVVVTIGAPDYKFTAATATAVIDNSNGIKYIQNTNVGSFYTNGYYSATIKNTSTQKGKRDAVINFEVSNGHIDVYGVSDPGALFPSSLNGTIVTIPYISAPAKAYVDAVTVNGAIISYHVVSSFTGKFYSSSNLQFTKHTGNGTGVVTDLPTIFNGSPLYFSTSTKTLSPAVGTGFAVGDSLILSVNSAFSDEYTGKIHMTSGSVTGINITNEGANYIDGQVDVVIDSPATGDAATATAYVDNGKISQIYLYNSGNGYTSAPAVKIINKAEKIQAKATASINSDGQISYLDLTNVGNGYLSAPAVTITSAIPGIETGASAYAVVSNGKISDLVLVNKGNNFRSNIPSTAKSYSAPATVNVKGSSVAIINIDLGTGKRSIEN